MAATIVAMGGGGFSMNDGVTALDVFMLEQAAVERPRVCFIPTASGDADGYVRKFHADFARVDCEPSHLSLFARSVGDLAAFAAQHDVFYVGGGNTANLLAIWRLHGLVEVLQAEAAKRDIVVGGMSAGAMCWFAGGITDSFGSPVRPLGDGLGWLPGSFCPHYDADRRLAYHAAVLSGALAPGTACDDGVAAVYIDGQLSEYVGELAGAQCVAVDLTAAGVVETALPVRYLSE